MDMNELNKTYDEILGAGEPVVATEEPKEPAKGDAAYGNLDYSGQSGDKVDPRDPSTFPEKKDDEPEPEPDDNEPEGSVKDTEEYEDIPDELVAAGRQAGFSDEEIIDLDATNPAVLTALVKAYKQATGPEVKKAAQVEPKAVADTEPKKKDEELALNLDLAGLDDELSRVAGPVQDVVTKLIKQVADLKDDLGKTRNVVDAGEQHRQAEGIRQIDAFFDSRAKEVPELGKSGELTETETDARIYAWRIAKAMVNDSNGELAMGEALKVGVNALRGQTNEVKLKARIASDLNKRKKQFTARPRGSRRTGGGSAKTEKERGMAAIDEVLDDPKYG